MLKKYLLLIILCLSIIPLHAQEADNQTVSPIIPLPFLQKEDPEALFDYTIDDSRIEFYAEGSWEADIAEQVSFTFPSKESPKIELLIPVFSQKVDLSLWFLLQNSWYFEAAFADGFEKNTVAAGYFGDGFIKHARISNRAIRLAQNHALNDIGGGENQAPGITVQMGKGPWEADVLVRYDTYTDKSKSFIGSVETGKTNISSELWLRSVYSLPSEKTAAALSDIFIEDEGGSFVHSSGKKLRKLSPGEYIVLPSEKILILKQPYEGIILASISPEVSVTVTTQRVINELGSFSSGGFLHSIQDEFSNSDRPIDLASFTYGGNDGIHYVSAIDGIEETILLIQNPPFFSPFVCARYYASETQEITNASVIFNTGSQRSTKFGARISSNSQIFSRFTSSNNQLIEVFRYDEEALSNNPFAPEFPSLYISTTDNTGFTYSIELSSSSTIEAYSIGADAIPGTIKVTKNGLEVRDYTFDEKMGTIVFDQEPKDSDQIVISWKEEAGGFDNGFAAFAGGITYTVSPELFINGGLSLTYPILTAQKFSTADSIKDAAIQAAAGIDYSSNGFSVQNELQINAVHSNPSGLLRIEGMDQGSVTNYLGKKSVQQLSTTALPHLNPRKTEAMPVLTLDNKMINTTLEAVTDSEITSYAFRNSWQVENTVLETASWTAVEIDLSSRTQELKNADLFSIAFKEELYTPGNDYEIYLQLGNAESTLDERYYEYSIGTWKISKKKGEPDPPDTTQPVLSCSSVSGWQTAQVYIQDKDRFLIQNKPFARVIFVQHSNAALTETVKSSVLIGPYEIVVPSFTAAGDGAYTYDSINIDSLEHEDIKQFNPKGKNTVQNLVWKKSDYLEGEKTAVFRKRITPIPLGNYKKLGFFLYTDNTSAFSSLTLNLLDQNEFFDDPVYSVTIDRSYIENLENTWIAVEIDTALKKMVINGTSYDLPHSIINNVSPDIVEITINTDHQKSGSIMIDELYARSNEPYYTAENRFSTSYKADGVILSVKNFPLVSDLKAEVQSDQLYSFTHNSFSAPVHLLSDVTLTALKLSGGVSSEFNADTQNTDKPNLTRIFHSISTVPLFPPFTVLSLNEDFSMMPLLKSAGKSNKAALQISQFPFPFSLKAQTASLYTQKTAEQNASAETAITVPGKYLHYQISANTALSQSRETTVITSQYGTVYSDTSKLQFSDASGAFKRQEKAEVSQVLQMPFLTLKPSFTVAGTNDFSNIKEAFHTSLLSFKTDIPFAIKRQQFAVSHIKEMAVKEKTDEEGSYHEDMRHYVTNIENSGWFFKEPLIKDLSSSILFETIEASHTASSTTFYTSAYNAGWKRPLLLNAWDFVLPSAFEAGITRSIISTGSKQGTDSILVTGGIGFTSFNTFGKFSSKPLVTWYEQDELIHSWKCDLKFEKNSGTLIDYSVTGFYQFTMFITDAHTLQQTADFSFSGKKSLSIKTGIVWNRPGAASPISNLILLITPLKKETIRLVRNTIINYSIDKKTILNHTVFASHELRSTLNTYLTITAKSSVMINFMNTVIEKIDIQAGIGALLQF